MNNNEIKSSAFSPQSLISFMEDSDDHWWIKDGQSRFIYMNDALLKDLNMPENFDVEGKLDQEIPIKPCQELWPEFVDHDKKVMAEDRMISAIEIHYYGEGNRSILAPHLADKMPLYDDQRNIIGTVGHGRMIDFPALLYYMHLFNRPMIHFDAPSDLFTKGELNIIFWVLQWLSDKEIAKRLDLSPRVVETKLQIIYDKAGVSTRIQLIEYCKDVGLDKYIPTDFIRKGVQLLKK